MVPDIDGDIKDGIWCMNKKLSRPEMITLNIAQGLNFVCDKWGDKFK